MVNRKLDKPSTREHPIMECNLYLLNKIKMYQNLESLKTLKYQQLFQYNLYLLFLYQSIEYHFIHLRNDIDDFRNSKSSITRGTIRDIKGNPLELNLIFYSNVCNGHSNCYEFYTCNSIKIGNNIYYFSKYCEVNEQDQFNSIFLNNVRKQLTCGQVNLITIDEVKSLVRTLIPNYHFKDEHFIREEFGYTDRYHETKIEVLNHQDPKYYQISPAIIQQQDSINVTTSQFPKIIIKYLLISSSNSTISNDIKTISLVCKLWNILIQDDEIWRLLSLKRWSSLLQLNNNHTISQSNLIEIQNYPNPQVKDYSLYHDLKRKFIEYIPDHLHIKSWKELFIQRFRKEQLPTNLLLKIQSQCQQRSNIDHELIDSSIQRYKEIVLFTRVPKSEDQDLNFLYESLIYRNYYFKVKSDFIDMDCGMSTQHLWYIVGTFMDKNFNQFEFKFSYREETSGDSDHGVHDTFQIFQVGNKSLSFNDSYYFVRKAQAQSVIIYFEELSNIINLDINSINKFHSFLMYISKTRLEDLGYPFFDENNYDIVYENNRIKSMVYTINKN
ncbi:hypothetical protein DLAC_11098 [Tieghemostelium lacteum]|uniref:F-box domain-containing protein n=1 Tax=Tieghemostelium lacteum TaxID=361077 RepID=A0A151Z368_TIELA|nr:hypothetical protein DLAC_11098 [Tieghemostelium lacteum]|eukprot:KYQ88400.1 hypothetical protein DLAC_11098 [Tieghemostelium lacteum]